MSKVLRLFVVSIFVFKLHSSFAAVDCNPATLVQHPQHILGCYIKKPSSLIWKFQAFQYDAVNKISIETYLLTSQIWQGVTWQHTLVIYRPDAVRSHQALLLINGGTRYPAAEDNPVPTQLNFAHIAHETQTVVVDLQDVPNQYITFADHVPRKEDSIVAYSWNRFMDDPIHNQDWPLHLPMTKTIIKAMDATQAILHRKNIQVDHFVVAGASKRGWTAWLAAISDTRINAIVPIVIDILNLQKNIQHIYAFYNNNWPVPAFHDYMEQGIPDRLSSPEFATLAKIEDPFSYLDTPEGKKRLAIPKYIISAGRDDFFVPDALNLYINNLPGETELRIFPQEGHYIDMKNSVGPALLSFYRMIVNNERRPRVSWHVNTQGVLDKVTTNKIPEKIQLCETTNPNARDFRKLSVKSVVYQTKEIKNDCITNHCEYSILMTPPATGWKTAFVEIYFKKPNGEYLILTTPAFVEGMAINK
jgi:PhoPQ-activated pathogenicity-related protein